MGKKARRKSVVELGLRRCEQGTDVVLDRHIDARNPRTAARALPAGRISARAAVGVLAMSAACFGIVCASFGVLYGNWWPLILAAPVLAGTRVHGAVALAAPSAKWSELGGDSLGPKLVDIAGAIAARLDGSPAPARRAS